MSEHKNPLDDLAAKIAKTDDPAALDSDLSGASDLAKQKLSEPTQNANLTQGVIDRLNKEAKQAAAGNTVAQTQPKPRNPFQPDIQVTQAKAGFSSQETRDHLNPDVMITPPPSSADQNTAKRQKAAPVRSATEMDMSLIDESNVLDLPFIDAHSFDIPAMLQLKPKLSSVRFRWVNYKNYEGGNYAMFKAIGFSNASPEDVAGEISEHLCKEDGTIKWFDVMLMKVDVLKLMGVYKKNIIKALQMVGRWQPQAIAQAKRTLENEVGSDVLNALRAKGHTIEFYAPSTKEMSDQDKAFAEGY